MHGLQRDATAIFYFACHRWIEIGPVIVRFSRAQTRHCNNIMAGIMTSKPACHKAIGALLSAARWARGYKLDQIALKVNRLENMNDVTGIKKI